MGRELGWLKDDWWVIDSSSLCLVPDSSAGVVHCRDVTDCVEIAEEESWGFMRAEPTRLQNSASVLALHLKPSVWFVRAAITIDSIECLEG